MKTKLPLLLLIISLSSSVLAVSRSEWQETKASFTQDNLELANLKNYYHEPYASCAGAVQVYQALQEYQKQEWLRWEKFVDKAESHSKNSVQEAQLREKVRAWIPKHKRSLSDALQKMEGVPDFQKALDGHANQIEGCTEDDYVLLMQYRKKMLSLFSKITNFQENWTETGLDP